MDGWRQRAYGVATGAERPRWGVIWAFALLGLLVSSPEAAFAPLAVARCRRAAGGR